MFRFSARDAYFILRPERRVLIGDGALMGQALIYFLTSVTSKCVKRETDLSFDGIVLSHGNNSQDTSTEADQLFL